MGPWKGAHDLSLQTAVRRGIRCYNLEPGYVATERVQARASLGWIAGQGKSPAVVGGVAAWMLRQPDSVIANGRTVSVDETARELGLL